MPLHADREPEPHVADAFDDAVRRAGLDSEVAAELDRLRRLYGEQMQLPLG